MIFFIPGATGRLPIFNKADAFCSTAHSIVTKSAKSLRNCTFCALDIPAAES